MSRMPADEVLAAAAHFFNTTVAEVKGRGRFAHLVLARAVVCKVLRDRGLSYPQTARFIGKSDHTTAINLVGNWAWRTQRNPELLMIYDMITRNDVSALLDCQSEQARRREAHARLLTMADEADRRKEASRTRLERAVLNELTLFAEDHLPCPTNGEIAEEVGGGIRAGTITHAIARLEKRGDITVTRNAGGRVITITASGLSTAERDVRSPTARGWGADMYMERQPSSPPEAVHRDYCQCGTRMDLPAPWCRRPHAKTSAQAFMGKRKAHATGIAL